MKTKLKEFLKGNRKIYNFISRFSKFAGRHNLFWRYRNFSKFKLYVSNIKDRSNNSNYIYCMLEPNHGNIGDTAIAVAIREFLAENFDEYTIIGISIKEYQHFHGYLEKEIMPTDLITIIGGGNMGNQYMDEERARRDIITRFSSNIVISFPQSIYFTNDKHGLRELAKSVIAYGKNEKLILIARDSLSFQIMQNSFKDTVILLTPDIVFYLNYSLEGSKFQRKGISLFLRDDIEGTLDGTSRNIIEKTVKKHFSKVEYKDTNIDQIITRENALNQFNSMIELFLKSEMVITDRLHGMIFSVITATPCIVFGNYNHKIKEQYKWVEDVETVIFCSSLDNLDKSIEKLINTEAVSYDRSFAIDKFTYITETIRKMIDNQSLN